MLEAEEESQQQEKISTGVQTGGNKIRTSRNFD